mmetsp:Transcript_100569/g.288163  ORF Transcript_100569/g.288163 Transcript_100569/m.288163 type:complete len:230 (-) Transcript_100569:520-1209(-)
MGDEPQNLKRPQGERLSLPFGYVLHGGHDLSLGLLALLCFGARRRQQSGPCYPPYRPRHLKLVHVRSPRLVTPPSRPQIRYGRRAERHPCRRRHHRRCRGPLPRWRRCALRRCCCRHPLDHRLRLRPARARREDRAIRHVRRSQPPRYAGRPRRSCLCRLCRLRWKVPLRRLAWLGLRRDGPGGQRRRRRRGTLGVSAGCEPALGTTHHPWHRHRERHCHGHDHEARHL